MPGRIAGDEAVVMHLYICLCPQPFTSAFRPPNRMAQHSFADALHLQDNERGLLVCSWRQMCHAPGFTFAPRMGAVVQRLQQPQAVTVHDAAPDWIAAVAQQERNVPNLVSSMPVTLYGSLLLLCHYISPFSRGHVSSRCCLPAWTPNVCIDSEPCLLSLLGL